MIALALLAELAKPGLQRLPCHGQQVLHDHAPEGGRTPGPAGQGDSSGIRTCSPTPSDNSLDVLIVDEAHRIRLTSNNRFTRAEKRSGTPQADELVRAARVPVFLIDEHQAVRPDEIGTVASIEEAAARNGAAVRRIDLDGQFRYGGSEIYARWVEQLLGLSPGGPQPWPGDDAFQLLLAGSPEQMEAELRGKIDQGYVSRITAGFCWPWSNPRPDGTLVDDIVIGSWRRPWNLRCDKALNDIPPGPAVGHRRCRVRASRLLSTPRRALNTTMAGRSWVLT